MRKFRNSAIALVSAAAISFGGMSVASAQDTETDPDGNNEITQVEEDEAPGLFESFSSNGSTASKWGEDYEADQPGYGTDGFGSSRDDSGNGTPRWLRAWGTAFDVVTVGGVLGLIVFPIVNFMKYNGLIK